MVQIKQQLVSQNVINQRTYGKGNPCNYIVIHETANINKGANAQTHANLQSNLNPREASWQYTVDDKQAIQSFPDNVKCWHGSDGPNGKGNTQGIGIEICVNSDGDFKKAVKNAAELTKHLMKKHNIPANKVIQHHETSGGKDCPRYLRNGSKGVNWSQFKAMLSSTKPSTAKQPSKPVSKPTSSTKPAETGSIVDYMNANKMDSSFNNRAKLATQYGIKGYSGTAKQNLDLLAKLKAGKPVSKPSKPTSKPYKVGQKVKIKSSAKKYSRSTASIPAQYKNKAYTIQQVGKDDVLIKELYSWVRKSDLQ